MAQNVNSSTTSALPRPPAVATLIEQVACLLRDGQPAKALELIVRAKIASPWTENALGVCQLRLGKAQVALEVFRSLAVAPGGLTLRADVPVAFKTNFATALLLAGETQAGAATLREIRDNLNPAVQRLRQAICQWRAGLSFWQRVDWHMGGQPRVPMDLGFPPGDLE